MKIHKYIFFYFKKRKNGKSNTFVIHFYKLFYFHYVAYEKKMDPVSVFLNIAYYPQPFLDQDD